MLSRAWFTLPLVAAVLIALMPPARSCCPAPPRGGKMPVVNADQNVIIIWDAKNGVQHFIRRASFKSEANDFGFLVPSPTQPKVLESGDEAFPALYDVTKPEVIEKPAPRGGGGCTIGCGAGMPMAGRGALPDVRVLDEGTNVAGFDYKVLQADTSDALAGWLKKNKYAYSPEVAAWAKPYIEKSWPITALKVTKQKDAQSKKDVSAKALRMSFKTDRPLFPYREPDYKGSTEAVGATSRLLRIYFLSDARYDGSMGEQAWTGKPVWSGKVSEKDREKVLGHLKLTDTAKPEEWWRSGGPKEWWLTEFEDPWPYKVAPADVYFSKSANQETLKREPVIRYVSAKVPNDVMMYALALAMFAPVLLRRARRK